MFDVAGGSIGTNNGLLHLGALELGNDGGWSSLVPAQNAMTFGPTSNGKTALHILLGKPEGELLGVVVDDLRLLQLQRNEALLASSESQLCRS